MWKGEKVHFFGEKGGGESIGWKETRGTPLVRSLVRPKGGPTK